MFDTLLLTQGPWDLCIDAGGNIARASPPYSLAQDVASALRLFLGELWYDTTKGVPYFQTILGQTPPLSLFRELMVDAALTVPGVVSATCVISGFDEATRTVTGQVDFIDEDGQQGTVAL